MKKIRVAVFGTGYWASLQIPSWIAAGAEVVGVWNRTYETAQKAAAKFGIQNVYTSPEEVFEKADFDIADIITSFDQHKPIALLAAQHKKAAICQKPMAPTWEECLQMVKAFEEEGLWFAVHENFRYRRTWQQIKGVLQSGELGRLYRAKITMRSATPDRFAGSPGYGRMDHMALKDMGPHIFDVTRFLFGEACSIYCRQTSTHPEIGTDDEMISLLEMKSGMQVQCELCNDDEPSAFISAENGTLSLRGGEKQIRVCVAGKTRYIERAVFQKPEYIPQGSWEFHSGEGMMSIKAFLEDVSGYFVKKEPAPTCAKEYIKTMELVFQAVRSADENCVCFLAR